MSKFNESGYSEKELVASKEYALQIYCDGVLRTSAIDNFNAPKKDDDTLTYVIIYDKTGLAHILENQ